MEELTLQQLYEANPESDKGSVHSYISDYYEEALKPYRHTAKSVLEIGVLNGGSTRLWKKYFTYAGIVGIDITPQEPEPGIAYICGDAYHIDTISLFDQQFDVIIDDGPHTLESQIDTILRWSLKLNPGGLMVIEDVQSIQIADILLQYCRLFKCSARIVDLRHIKGRYDDLLIEIRKPA